MTEGIYIESQHYHRIGEGGDRWRCSRCGGYVRGNAPMCKHCHAPFGEPEPIPPKEVRATCYPKRDFAERPFLAVGLWFAVLALIYVCWHVGGTLGGIAGGVAGSLLFITLATPLFAMWLYAGYRLPAPKPVGFAFDLLGVLTMFFFTIALPLIALFVMLPDDTDWVRESNGFAIFTVVLIASSTFVRTLRRFFDGPMSDHIMSFFDARQKLHLTSSRFVTLLVVILTPVVVLTYIASNYPSPFTTLARFVRLYWIIAVGSDEFRSRIVQFIGRQLERFTLGRA